MLYNSSTQIISQRLIINENYLNIYSCNFLNFNINLNGGCIYINNNFITFLISYSIFLNCNCNNNYGGAIYCQSNYGNSSLINICATKCFALYGQFFIISQNINSNQKFNLSSINYCSNDFLIRYFSSYFIYGNQIINNFNSSKNINNGYVSSFEMRASNSGLYNFCLINNNIGDATISYGHDGSSPCSLNNSNIINNSLINSNNYGIIYCKIKSGIYYINNCIIIKNKSPTFSTFLGLIEILNCSIDIFNFYSIKPHTINNNIINNINFNTFQFIFYCNNLNTKKNSFKYFSLKIYLIFLN